MVDPGLQIAYAALLILAVIPIYIGSWKSVDTIQPNPEKDGKPELKSKSTGVNKEVFSTSDAYWFPITGSCVLFGLYLIFRFLDKDHVNLLLSIYFSLMGAIALSSLFAEIMAPIESMLNLSRYELSLTHLVESKKKAKTLTERLVLQTIHFTKLTTVTAILAFILAGVYALTKHWTLNNAMGLAFSMSAIAMLDLDGFKTGMILLSGLFVYDVFWVFGTEVMVSVAKSFDAPVKMLWPKNILDFTGPQQFTMLGLGDIVIPGIYVALCLRFDYYNYLRQVRAQQQQLKSTKSAKLQKVFSNESIQFSSHFSTPYFLSNFVAYISGLTLTVVVMHTFKAAQPALLYLSPACILASLATALVRGEISELLGYSAEVDKDMKEAVLPHSESTHVSPKKKNTVQESEASEDSLISDGDNSDVPLVSKKGTNASGKKGSKGKNQEAEDAAKKRKRLEAERFDFEEQNTSPSTKRVHADDIEDIDSDEDKPLALPLKSQGSGKTRSVSPVKGSTVVTTQDILTSVPQAKATPPTKEKTSKANKKEKAATASKPETKPASKPAAPKTSSPTPAPSSQARPVSPVHLGFPDLSAPEEEEFQVVGRRKGRGNKNKSTPAPEPVVAAPEPSSPKKSGKAANSSSNNPTPVSKPAKPSKKGPNMLELAAEFDF